MNEKPELNDREAGKWTAAAFKAVDVFVCLAMEHHGFAGVLGAAPAHEL